MSGRSWDPSSPIDYGLAMTSRRSRKADATEARGGKVRTLPRTLSESPSNWVR